jgi:hypothetical protein
LTTSQAAHNQSFPMYGAPEHVFVENEWYDGPRAGVANVHGVPHRFVSQWDEDEEEYLGTFLVWPLTSEELALEQEQWLIFVAWNERYEAGLVTSNSHPGHPGTSKRWDEITELLTDRRESVPLNAKRAKAQIRLVEQKCRYAVSGPHDQLAWQLL